VIVLCTKIHRKIKRLTSYKQLINYKMPEKEDRLGLKMTDGKNTVFNKRKKYKKHRLTKRTSLAKKHVTG
jgi:hypothetical protein